MKQINLKEFVKKLHSKLTYNHVKIDFHRFAFISTLRSQSTYNVVAILALIVSVFTLILNHQTNRRANEFSNTANNLTSQVNSAEFELYKKLKYDALSMIAKLKAIDAIAAVAPHVSETIDYSREIEYLRELQASPVYPLLLYSVKDDKERLIMELRVRLLTTSNFSSYELRGWIHQIVKTIEENLDFKKYAKMDFDTLVKDLCTMECTFTAFNIDEWENRHINDDFPMFIKYLIDECKVKDPEVLLYYGVFKVDKVIVQKALNEGANTKVTEKQIISRYQKEYVIFTNGTTIPKSADCLKDKNETCPKNVDKGDNANLKESHRDVDFEMFTNYLIDECKVDDPDVLLFYAVFKNDTVILQKAIDEGANINVTDKQIIKRYQKEYENLINK